MRIILYYSSFLHALRAYTPGCHSVVCYKTVNYWEHFSNFSHDLPIFSGTLGFFTCKRFNNVAKSSHILKELHII